MKKYHKNPRTMTSRQDVDLRRWLRELGDLSGIVHDQNSDEIISGNQRARIMDINDCEITIIEDYDKADAQGTLAIGYVVWDGAKYNYRLVDWTPEQCEKANIIANKAGGDWDFDRLANEFDISDLLDWGWDVEELGMHGIELPGEEPTPDPGAQEDKAAELMEKWGVKYGQLWRLGRHRLMCGDCTDGSIVERLLDGAKPHLCVTDPPYGVEYDPNWRNEEAEKGHLAYADRRVGKVVNDDRIDWTEAWLLFPGDVIYSWHAGKYASVVQSSLEVAGFEIRNQIIWAKSNFPISRGNYHWRHEPCWYAVRKGRKSDWIGDRKQTTLWEINLDKNIDGGHSTQKPLDCMERPIINHRGDVYDPFVGSGTTLVAAERQGRNGYFLDIDPAYVAVTIQRFVDMTGGEPELLD